MTLSPSHPPAVRPDVAGDPLVFARGSDGGRRFTLGVIGLALLAAAWALFLFVNVPALRIAAGGMAAVGGAMLLFILWRRGKAFEVRREGIRLLDGGPVFGEMSLLPWESVTWLGARQTGEGVVRLVYRQQHITGERFLPGRPISIDAYDRLIDRLRVVLGNRYPNLRLGGVA